MKMKSVLFISHAELLPLDSVFAKSAKENFGYESIVLVHGFHEKQKAKALGFDQVIDISFSKEHTKISTSQRVEIINILTELEITYGKGAIRQDFLIDRHLKNRFSEDWILMYLISVYKIVLGILETNSIVFGIGEVNYASYRIVRKILAVNQIQFLMYIGTPFFDNRFYLDNSFFLKCELFQKELSKTSEIPESLLYKFKCIIENLKGGAEPSYTRIAREKGVWDGEESILQKFRRNALGKNISFWKNYIFLKEGKKGLPFRPLIKEMFFIDIILRRITNIYRKKTFQNLIYTGDYSKNYCVYFLHHSPEYTIDTLGGPFRDQLFLIKTIAEALPLNQILYVKEHVGMIGLRPTSVYKTISKLSNVELLPNNILSQKIIKNADIVFTVSGTPAIEAMINDVPAITFSYFLNSTFPGVIQCLNLFELPKLIFKCLAADYPAITESEKLNVINSIYSVSSEGILFGHNDNWLVTENIENLKIGFKEQINNLISYL